MKTNEFNEVVFTPNDGQAKILSGSERFKFAIAGIQGGKTTVGCIWSQMKIQQYPDKVGLICGLSHDQLNSVIIQKFLDFFPGYAPYYIKKDKTIYLPSGGRVVFKPLDDPKYVEGITAHWLWIDEADLITYKAYLIARGRISGTKGDMLCTSSIADGGWLADYASKMAESNTLVVNWRSKDNPAFSQEEWDALKMELDPAVFRRRYEAEYNKNSGRVYAYFDLDKHVKEKIPDDEKEVKSILGFDWGWNDPTGIVCLTITDKQNIYVTDEFYVEQATPNLIHTAVSLMRSNHKVVAMYGDPENRQAMEWMSRILKFTIQKGDKDIFSGTTQVRNLIYQNRFYVLAHNKHTLRELRLYRYKEEVDGATDEPNDENNHLLDPIRYIIATYPIPNKKKVIETPKDIPDFWLRRTSLYKQEKARYDENNTISEDSIWMP